MGEVHFLGSGAAATVQRLVTNDVARLENGRAFYTVACLKSGGIVDDLIVYRLQPDHYVAVVNASNIDKDVDWFQEHRGAACDVQDRSDDDGADRVPGSGRRAGAAAADDRSRSTGCAPSASPRM